jgi:hypothetical protein
MITKPKKMQLAPIGVKLLTTREAMSFFRATDTTSFLQLARRSGIPFIRIGARKLLWRESDLIAFTESRTVGAPLRPTAGSEVRG